MSTTTAPHAHGAPRASTPILTIARVELRQLRADAGLWAAATLFAAAAAYGVWSGREAVATRTQAVAAARVDERARLDSLVTRLTLASSDTSALRPFGDPRHPYAAATTVARRYVTLPTWPLASLASGQSDLFPAYYRVSPYARETFYANDDLESPTNLVVGRFDLAFVVVYLLPFVALALGYNVLSAEREQGTLGLVLSQPVRVRTLLLGKLGTRAIVTLLLALGVPLAVAALSGISLGAPGAPAGIGWWVVLVGAYTIFWFSVALLVNVLGRHSAANALAILGVWIVVVVLAPVLLNVVAAARHPAPSRVEMLTAERAASAAAERRGAALLGRYYQDHPELAQAGGTTAVGAPDFAMTRLAVLADVRQAVEPLTRAHESQLAGQQELVDRWRLASPAAALMSALQDLSGTGTARHRQLSLSIDQHMVELREFYEPRVFRRTALTPDDVARLPTFTMQEEPAEIVRARLRVVLLGLLGATAIVSGMALALLPRVRHQLR